MVSKNCLKCFCLTAQNVKLPEMLNHGANPVDFSRGGREVPGKHFFTAKEKCPTVHLLSCFDKKKPFDYYCKIISISTKKSLIVHVKLVLLLTKENV